jgi:hypothetical protein
MPESYNGTVIHVILVKRMFQSRKVLQGLCKDNSVANGERLQCDETPRTSILLWLDVILATLPGILNTVL